MKLILKNKLQIGVKAVMEEAEKKGGIPKHIELSTQEAEELLKEVHYLTNEKLNAANNVEIKWTKQLENLQDSHHPAFLVRMITVCGTRELLPQTVEQLITFWRTGGITVTCYGIPLLVDAPDIKVTMRRW